MFFTFPSYYEHELEYNSDLAVIGKIKSCEEKVLDVLNSTEEELKVKYKIHTIQILDRLKGECAEEIKVKVPFNYNVIDNFDGDFIFYLKEFDGLPYSPLNLKQGIVKL